MTYRADFSHLSNNEMMEHLYRAVIEMKQRTDEEGRYLSDVIKEKYTGGKAEAPRAFTKRVQDAVIAMEAIVRMEELTEMMPTIIGEGLNDPA